jgi:hypothetical protein
VFCNTFLSKGSVNTFPRKRILLKKVFSTRSVESVCKEDNWGEPVSGGLSIAGVLSSYSDCEEKTWMLV